MQIQLQLIQAENHPCVLHHLPCLFASTKLPNILKNWISESHWENSLNFSEYSTTEKEISGARLTNSVTFHWILDTFFWSEFRKNAYLLQYSKFFVVRWCQNYFKFRKTGGGKLNVPNERCKEELLLLQEFRGSDGFIGGSFGVGTGADSTWLTRQRQGWHNCWT